MLFNSGWRHSLTGSPKRGEIARSAAHLKNLMKPHRATSSAAFILLLALASSAQAQYIWLDEKGIKQYSDMPPPSSVPANRILKQPGGMRAPSGPEQNEVENAAPPKAAPTFAEQNAEFKKRRMEQAEQEKKTAEQAKLAADKAKNCDRTRDYLRTLEAGQRIVHTNKNGERAFLTDEQRAADMRDARRVLEECGK